MNYIPRTTISRVVCFFLYLTLLSVSITGCSNAKESSDKTETKEAETGETEIETSDTDDAALSENPRSEYEAKLAEVEELYKKDPDDQDTALQYSQILYKLGDFDEAQEVLVPYLNEENPSPDITYLSAQIEYLKGNYTEAESLYKILVAEYYDEYGMEAEAGLQMVYYQTNEYSKASQLFTGQDIENPLLDMMKAFDENPYQINWNGNGQTTIPFVTTDPLPVVPIEINGVKMNAFIDTGGAMLSVDETIASELGIEPISYGEGSGGGGTANISFGKTDSLSLGEIDIQNIPVMTLSFEGFKNVFDGYTTDVHAIIGTNVLQQFKPTIDYLSGQLVLSPRDDTDHESLNETISNKTVLEEVPFSLANTHYMFSKGSVNGYTGLNMFVDSGMPDDNGVGIELSKETMDLLDIPMPELSPLAEGEGGIGGSDSESGVFDLSSYGLNNLQLKEGMGIYNTSDILSPFIDDVGFIGDTLISHNYLKQYKWTIDFDAMEMTFSK